MTLDSLWDMSADGRSRSFFMSFTSGQFGCDVISDYLTRLKNFARLGVPTVAEDYLKLSLQAMAEMWRRLVLPTQGFPYCLFNLLSCESDGPFLELYASFQAKLKSCHQCGDVEFSHIVLSFIDDVGNSEASCRASALRQFLDDLSVCCPLSSDLVECLHGYSQHLLHRWRGSKPSDAIAQERVQWTLITKSHSKLRDWVWAHYADFQCGKRLHHFGKSSCNQYSKAKAPVPDCRPTEGEGGSIAVAPRSHQLRNPSKTLSVEKMDQLLALGQESSLSMPRKVCGPLAYICRL